MQVNTEAIAGEGKILTAGGVDTHIHFICPQLAEEAIASGKVSCYPLSKSHTTHSQVGVCWVCVFSIIDYFANNLSINFDPLVGTGVTTLVGGGTGPASGTCATTCTPSPEHMRLMLQATDKIPLNIGFTGKVKPIPFFSCSLHTVNFMKVQLIMLNSVGRCIVWPIIHHHI